MELKNLPDWARYNEKDNIIELDPDVIYPIYLEKLGYDIAKVTQSQLECARLCFTKDLYQITGKGLRIRILKNEKYRLSKLPAGKPINWFAEHKRISKKSAG